MKKLLILALTMALVGPVHAAFTVGRVNVQEILLSIKEGKAVRQKLEQKFNQKKKELEKEQTTIQKLQQDFQKQRTVLSKTALDKKEKDIREKMMAFEKKTLQSQREIQDLEKKFKKPILQKIKKVIEAVSKRAKVSFTFEESSAPIFYAEKEVDLTKQVIQAYDQKYSKKKK